MNYDLEDLNLSFDKYYNNEKNELMMSKLLTDDIENKTFESESPDGYQNKCSTFFELFLKNGNISENSASNYLIEKEKSENEEFKESTKNQAKFQRNRGRRKKGEYIQNRASRKYRRDNIKSKINIHFVNFVIEFTNGLVKGGLYKINNNKFRKLSHIAKTRFQKYIFEGKRVRDMLSMEISSKYKIHEHHNEETLNQILKYLTKKNCDNSLFINYINTPIKQIFNKIYLSKQYEQVLEEYQINKNRRKICFFAEFIQSLQRNKDRHYIHSLEEEVKIITKYY